MSSQGESEPGVNEPVVRINVDGRDVAVPPGTTVTGAIALAYADGNLGVYGRDLAVHGLDIDVDERDLTAHGHGHGLAVDGRDPSTPAFRASGSLGEPRAPICGMGICHECRVTVDGVAQVRSCLTTVRDGMVVETTGASRRASLSAETTRTNTADRTNMSLSAGTPRTNGAGRTTTTPGAETPRTNTAERANASLSAETPLPTEADVIIVGAGPAGLAAARVAGAAGRDVLLLDENAQTGGQIWRGGSDTRAIPKNARFVSSIAVVDHRPGDRHTAGTLVLLHQGRLRELHYHDLVLATGARELFLPFPGWTLPGVFGAGGLQALVKGGWPIAGTRVVVAGTGPLLLAVASFLRERGADVALIAEQTQLRSLLGFGQTLLGRREKWPQMWELRTSLAGVPYRTGQWIVAAEGRGRVERVVVTNGTSRWTEPCDAVAVGYGLVPSNELARLIGCETDERGRVRVGEFQRTDRPHVYAIGELTGIGGVDLSEVEGEIVGHVLGAKEGDYHPTLEPRLLERRAQAQEFADALERAFELRPELMRLADDETIVCRCEDVTWRELAPHRAWRDAKLVTRCGMGACQGRVCGAALRELKGWTIDTSRPPISPVPVGAWED